MASTSSQGGSKFISFDGRAGKRYKPKSWNSNEDLLQDKNTHMSSQALQRKPTSYKIRGSLSDVRNCWIVMGPEVKAKISAAGLNHFLTSIYNDGIVEHKDINLIIALSERFWDTTNTFHFPGIGEVMLTPLDFAVITGLRIGGERIEVNDNLTNCDVERLLGGLPPKGSELNVKLSWLVKHLRGIEDVEMCVRSFMLLLIGQVLSPNTGSTVSLRYLASLENVDDIGKYDWGGMTYATLLHYMVQYSRCAMNNLGGPLFTWEIWMYEYFGVGPKLHNSKAQVFPRFFRWSSRNRISGGKKRTLQDWRLIIESLTETNMNLDPWQVVTISNKYSGLTLNRRKILFECPLGRYWYLGDRVLAQVDHKYPPLLPQDPPDSMRKGGLLEGDDLKAALAGSDAMGVAGDYGEFVQRRLQGRFAHLCGETVSCFNGALVMYSNGLVLQGTAEQGSDSEGSSPEGNAPQPSSHVEGPSGSFQERYLHFPSWSCRVMNQDGSIGYTRLDRPEHAPNVPWTGQVAIGTDLVDESLLMIESLQQTVYTQSAQNFSLRAELASARSHIQTMEGLFERLGVGAGPRRSQRGDEGGSGSRNTRRSSRRRTQGPSDEDEDI
ncbi:uncharacterized protein LOC115969900 [Quercus lobata]|uniref:uncharacterized protein LOC115969900 n=1 Tax=Quercus lobata TaxID=97700 RepID=UPI0012447D39|nr:uncharacterized protein LOC115969900 [Quercus lobata]